MMIHRCPRRDDTFGYIANAGMGEEALPDTWQTRAEVRTCSYCGSLHPEAFIASCYRR